MVNPSCHMPVLLPEVIEWLQPAAGNTFVDGTLGGGGHTLAIAESVLPNGKVLAVDLDPAALERSRPRCETYPVILRNGSYTEIPHLMEDLKLGPANGILLDLGLSSDQLADAERGFSFNTDGDLDMRFDPASGQSASELLAHIGERDLANLIYKYGEERFSRRIAKQIVSRRRESPLRTVAQLAELVRSCVPRSRGHQIDPATRTFQALRIAVNDELGALETALATLPDCLMPGGRLAIISFHSLEDRLVKHGFRNDDRLTVLTKRPVQAGTDEIRSNPRARSAKLRVAERRELAG